MGLAEDLKALQELRDKGELSESAYAAARDAAIGKQDQGQPQPTAQTKKKPLIGTPIKVIIVIAVLFVGLDFITRKSKDTQTQSSNNFFHTPQTITDEVENVPAASWKGINYGLPQGGKLDITVSVINGNPIDVFLTSADSLDAMNKGEWRSVKAYSNFNATKTRTYHRTELVGPGNYYLVLRDTSLGVLSAHASDVSVKTILTP
jgi:hypothetical protein